MSESIEKNEINNLKAIRLSQTDVPAYSIEEALRVADALNQYGRRPTRPLLVAKAMGMSPSSGPFRMLTGASCAYELTDGAARADSISLTPLGKRVVAPTDPGDDLVAKREAVLKPRIVRDFLQRYDGKSLPPKDIALNVLDEMGVPINAADRAYKMIIANAEGVGLLENFNGSTYVNLTSELSAARDMQSNNLPTLELEDTPPQEVEPERDLTPESRDTEIGLAANDLTVNKRVFVSHGKNRDVVAQLKEVLTFGGFEPVISVENESVAKPVPDKVMDDMRTCAAGIVHIGADKTLLDQDGNSHQILNPNVLIEIGAAMALYNRNFILLVEKDVKLPSNMQGLYEVRYEGSKLDYEATMKLLKAFNDFRQTTSIESK